MPKRTTSTAPSYGRISRKPKQSVVRKSILQLYDDGDIDDAQASTAPLVLESYDHYDLGDDPEWGPDPEGDAMEDPYDASDASPHPNDAAFYKFMTAQVKISAPARSWRDRQQRAFNDWVERLDDLLQHYLAVSRGTLPSSNTWRTLFCQCDTATISHLVFIDFQAAETHPVRACSYHLPELLIRSGLVPSTVLQPRVAFSFGLVRQFLALQDHARIGAFDFARATLQALTWGTLEVPPSASWTSRDTGRRPLRSASEWLQAVEQRCADVILHSAILHDFQRPRIDHDDLHLDLHALADRCPACFGGMLKSSSSSPSAADSEPTPSLSLQPQVIVCLDGNFQHKRVKAKDAVRQMPRSPSYFLSQRQLEAARIRFENPSVSEGPRTGCSSEVRAAIDGAVKTSKVDFDIGGVVGMTCRHGSPLILVDVRASGEKHYYAFALIEALLEACGSDLQSLGICYDIGCKLAVSPRLQSALAQRSHAVIITHVVSVFHVYGHDYDCQLKYSPRRTSGFGLTDGEALERLWSALSDLVSLTRDMSEADRLSTLTSRLESLSRDHRQDLLTTVQRRLSTIAVTRERMTQEFLQLLPYLVQYTNQSVADAYSSTSPRTGLPADLTNFILDLIERRRKAAFNKDAVVRQLSTRQHSNTKNRILDLSVPAKQLYLPLRNWHFLTAVLRRRHGHSQDGTARLISSKNGSASEAKACRAAFNTAVDIFKNALPGHLKGRLHTINEDVLFLPTNLTYIQGLFNPADIEDEPWVADSVLATAMDIITLLFRLDEEQTRIADEIAHMHAWYLATETSLQELLAVYAQPESSLHDPDRAAFVSRRLDWLYCVVRVWKARLSKIASWQQAQVASLKNRRGNLSKHDHVARIDMLLDQLASLADSWSTWSDFTPSSISVSSISGPLQSTRVNTGEDGIAAALVEDEDAEVDQDVDGERVHQLDRAQGFRHPDGADKDEADVDEVCLTALLNTTATGEPGEHR
ncbi:hypothetical protein CF319_g8190 [Tilletia indica]|nr:hypothetical protein CF319_g8190 [Tilletia indica]